MGPRGFFRQAVSSCNNITLAGVINAQGQPAFQANWGAGVTSGNFISSITEELDIGGWFDPSTGRWTAGFACRAMLGAIWLNSSNAGECTFAFYKNGSTIVTGAGRAQSGTFNNGVTGGAISLAANDYLQLKNIGSNSNAAITDYTKLWGFVI